MTGKSIAALAAAFMAATLLVHGAGADAAPKTGKEAGEKTSSAGDAFTKGKIVGALAFNPNVSVFNIDVSVYDGVAHLVGLVDTPVEREIAIEIARGIEGVTEVRSDIEVKPGTRKDHEQSRTAGRAFDDAAITTAIKGRLLVNGSTSGLKVNVTTRSGVVTLAGTVKSDAEKDLAGLIAENTSGVIGVENGLTVAKKK